MSDLLIGNFATRRCELWPPDVVRVVSWNINRGMRLPEITGFLASQRADLLILQEVDLNARRTRGLNIAEEIARKLEMNYVFGREFHELTQGSRTAPAWHGQATLSRWHLGNPRVIRFRRQSGFWRSRWFVPRTAPFQDRLGGRIALVTELSVGGRNLAVYNLHLESRGDNDLSWSQFEEVLADTARYIPSFPALVAGDFNFDASHALPAHALQLVGFRSAIGLPSPSTTTPRGLFRHRRTIDWAYVSGSVDAALGRVHGDLEASDHYPISFELGLRTDWKRKRYVEDR